MEETRSKSNNGVIIFLVLALCACVGVIVYLSLTAPGKSCPECEICKETTEEVETVKEEIGTYPNLYTTNLNKKNIITLYDRFLHSEGFIFEPDLDTINYDKVIYLGYKDNEKYYKVTGTYTCMSAELTCVYEPQGNDPISGSTYELYSGIIVFEKNEEKDYYELKYVNSNYMGDEYTEVNEEVN